MFSYQAWRRQRLIKKEQKQSKALRELEREREDLERGSDEYLNKCGEINQCKSKLTNTRSKLADRR